jgi:large subunit ribosomal protein L28
MFIALWDNKLQIKGGVIYMAKCEVCSKETVFGNNVSHSIRKTNRNWKPNIRKVKILDNGTPKTVKVCARCLRSNKVTRAI